MTSIIAQNEILYKLREWKTVCTRSSPIPTHLRLAQLSDLELFEDLRGGEDAGVDDAGDGEGAADDGADRRHEVVQRRPRLVVLHRYRV